MAIDARMNNTIVIHLMRAEVFIFSEGSQRDRENRAIKVIDNNKIVKPMVSALFDFVKSSRMMGPKPQRTNSTKLPDNTFRKMLSFRMRRRYLISNLKMTGETFWWVYS